MKKDNQKNDHILMIGAVLLFILSGFFIFRFPGAKKQDNSIIGKASLTIDFSNGKKRIFEGEIVKGETLIDALNQASKAGGFSVETFTANEEKLWRWYLNNNPVNKPPYEITLNPNDEILIKYAQ